MHVLHKFRLNVRRIILDYTNCDWIMSFSLCIFPPFFFCIAFLLLHPNLCTSFFRNIFMILPGFPLAKENAYVCASENFSLLCLKMPLPMFAQILITFKQQLIDWAMINKFFCSFHHLYTRAISSWSFNPKFTMNKAVAFFLMVDSLKISLSVAWG